MSLGRTVKYDAHRTPGPGKYDYIKNFGEDKQKKTFSARLRQNIQDKGKVPPNLYNPEH